MTLQPGEYHLYLNRNVGNITVIDTTGNVLKLSVYPNPIDNTSIAELNLPETGTIQLDLWNVQGQKVRTLLTGVMNKGKYPITLKDKINNLADGIYFLKAQTKNDSRMVKILIR